MGAVTSLIVRFKAGSDLAYAKLYNYYRSTVIAVARRQLGPLSRGGNDPEDVAQIALFDLHREVKSGRPIRDRLIDRESLLRTLSLLTAQKVYRLRRDNLRLKRDERRCVTLTDLSREDTLFWAEVSEAKSDPDWAATFRLTWDELMERLTGQLRSVVEDKFAGYTNAEIADRLNVSERAVERLLHKIRRIWREHFGLG